MKTFFCTRSLWQAFGFFWAAMVLMLAFWLMSLYLLPSYYYLPFGALCAASFFGFILYKKEHPDFLFQTEHRAIMKSGTLPQKLGVFFFIAFFFGPLGWGLAVLLGLKIYAHVFNYGGGFVSVDLLCYSFLFSCLMATFMLIGGIADRKRRM